MIKKFSKIFLLTLLFSISLLSTQAHANGKAVRIGTAICVDKNGKAQCTPDYGAILSQTGRVIGNGWVNYGPWAPRPGFGVIIP